MKRIVWTVAAVTLFAAPALAQTTFAELDTDGSGGLNHTETLALIPDLTEAEFTTADTDQSGELSLDEVTALAANRG